MFNPFGGLRMEWRWSIGIFTGRDPFRLAPPPGLSNPVLRAWHVRDLRAVAVADPFLIQQRDSWLMFFEVVDASTLKGSIGLAESADGLRWRYRKIVLSEPFHLSYPYVFEWQGRHYLAPETESQRSVRLYEAESFPLRWKKAGTLVSGRPFHDPSLFRHAERWWLFAGVDGELSDTLCLFHAPELRGPWQEHPMSPVVRSNPSGARPGGRVLLLEGRIIRFGQVAVPYYGSGLKAFEILRLTPSDYREREIPPPIPPEAQRSARWNADGMHHLDLQPMGRGGWLACADGLRKRRVFSL